MAVAGYSGDYNYSKYTPLDNTGTQYDVFQSGYKNIRFNIQQTQQIQLDDSTAYNLPGICYQAYGDTSLWYGLMAYNGLSDPLTDIQPGIVLLIPPKSAIQAYISRQASSSASTITV
jgi:hypothetical protein